MSVVQCDLQLATVDVPAEVFHEEIRSTMINAVTGAGTKAKNTTTTTTEGVVDGIGIIASIMYVFMLLFEEKSKASETIVYVVVTHLAITNVRAAQAWATSFVGQKGSGVCGE